MAQDVFDLDAALAKGPGATRVFDLDAALASKGSPELAAANSKYTVNPSGPMTRFVKGVASSLNPVKIAEGLGTAAGLGLAAVDREGLPGALASGGRALVDAQSRGLINAWDLAGEGRTTEALGQAVSGVLPIVGPMARGLGEEAAQTGDLAGALGEGVGMAIAPRVASKVPPAVRLVDGRVIQPLRKVGGKALEKASKSDIAQTAVEMAKDNAPAVVGGAIGGAIAGPWGAAAGGTAGKVLQESWKASSKKVRDAAKKAARDERYKAMRAEKAKAAKESPKAEPKPEPAPKPAEDGAMFNAKTGEPIKMTPEQAKAAVDELPWNKNKAEKAKKPNPQDTPKTPAKTRLELMMDRVEKTGKELTIEVEGATPESIRRIMDATGARDGLSASTDGRFVLLRKKAEKTPAQAKFDKAKSDRLMKQVDEAVSPNAAFEILKKHGIDGKKIPTADARAIVDAVWTKKDSTYKSIEQWMADRSQRWNKMRTSSKKKGS